MRPLGIIILILVSMTSYAQNTTLIFIRHAEKADNGKDTHLSPDGHLRAEALKNTLSEVDVTAIYCTPYNRTRQTVTPTAEAKAIKIEEYPTTKPYGEFTKEILAAHKGKIVLIVGHSNTVPEILKALTNNSFAVSIEEHQFDNLFIVTIPSDGTASVLPLKYGKPTP